MKLPGIGHGLLGIAGCIGISVMCIAAVLPDKAKRVRWLVEEANSQNLWLQAEHKAKYGAMAYQVIGPYQWDTNSGMHIGVGTNRFLVELGFRDDGVVVWRRR